MQKIDLSNCGCSDSSCSEAPKGPVPLSGLPMAQAAPDDEPCCGPPAGPPSSPFEKPGFKLCEFVDTFLDTPVGQVPSVKNSLAFIDHLGTIRTRLGISRDQYKVAPGLYATGKPNADSPVLVTANYKLSFDALRKELSLVDAWILVLDTRGINVWCAAGKKTFGTDEIIHQVKRVNLDKVVSHRKLILPQLGAPGVAAHHVKKGCGFKVIWGPIRAEDLREFLASQNKADSQMRKLTFSIFERACLAYFR